MFLEIRKNHWLNNVDAEEAKLWSLRTAAKNALPLLTGKDRESCRSALNYAEEELRTKFGRIV